MLNLPQLTVNEKDAAQYLAMSVAWLRQGRMRGRGPAFVRFGRTIRYRIVDLDLWLDQHRVDPARRGAA